MLTFNFSPFPELETSRLKLRRLTSDDIPDIYQIRKTRSLMQFIARPVATSEQDAIDLLKRVDKGIENNETINWGITLKNDSKVIGMVGFVRSTREHHRAEVGYILEKEYHRQGIMSDALHRILRYGFEQMQLHLAEAVIDPRNTASEGVLLKLGFEKQAFFKENFFYEGEFLNSVHLALLSRDFKS